VSVDSHLFLFDWSRRHRGRERRRTGRDHRL